MAELRSHQNNEHVAQLIAAALTQPQTGRTGPSTVAGGGGSGAVGSRGVGAAVKCTSMPARTPKPSQQKSAGKLSSGLTLTKQNSMNLSSNRRAVVRRGSASRQCNQTLNRT